MPLKLPPTSNGPMDKFVKKMTTNQNGESSQTPSLHRAGERCDKQATAPGCNPPLTKGQQRSAPVPRDAPDTQEQEPHATHSFEWCWSDKKPTTFTCNKAGTVEDLLKRSSQFLEIAGKNHNKELVIVRDGKAISSHFPCSLIKNERLNIKYIKAVSELQQPVSGSVHRQRKGLSGEPVMFHVLTKGGKKVVNIMRNRALQKDIQEVTVYAFKDEKVKHALRRDGRFLKTLFKKNIALSNLSTEVTTEMSDFVDDLDGKHFKIILLNKSNPPESQESLEDAYMMQNEPQTSDCNGNPDPSKQSTTTESVKDNVPKKKPKLDGNMAPGNMLREIPNSKKILCQLSSQFQELVKGEKTQQGSKLSRIQNIFRVKFGKNAQTCREVKTMKKLMALSDSVCQVRVNDTPAGSGFLLFGRCVLTNAHVVQNIYNESTGQLNETVTVHFSFESLNQTPSGAAVKEVAGFESGPDASGHEFDWALLRLAADQKLPGALLKHYGLLPQSGAICIIGHPDGGVKKIDPCLIVSTENRTQVAERHHRENPAGVLPEDNHYSENRGHIQLVTNQFFEDVAKDVNLNRQALTYESCFYFGSSGSPVFDEHCNVIAVHSGGYAYCNVRGERQSVIEYGQPLSLIIEHIVVQMVEKGRFDVLKEYLACDYARHTNTMSSLKKLVESTNLTAFKNAVNNLPSTSDESLKTFFEFFSQTEAPVPMEID